MRATDDPALWQRIRRDTARLSYARYSRSVGDVESYRALEAATERFLRRNVGVHGGAGGPCLIELIWSYWQEEGMLVQSLDAVVARVGRRGLLQGYAEGKARRLTARRRASEYDHQYGLALTGKAVPRKARSEFPAAFHRLLHAAATDARASLAPAFAETQGLLLAEGAHNQFGDLPSQARSEMLMQQWLLGRPEFRESLPGTIAVPYPEDWMATVDAMRRRRGLGESSIRSFSELARSGEQLLLSLRHGHRRTSSDRQATAAWARFWRPEVQAYLHAHRAVGGAPAPQPRPHH